MLEKNKKATYDEKSDIIDHELRKRRPKWFLTSIAWFDFDDVCQVIRTHLFRKWEQWDQERPLEPWINKIISNQMKNVLRNHYSNFVKPCLSCPFNQSDVPQADQKSSSCSFTPSGEQCGECPLYSKWEKNKKAAYDIKMASPLEEPTTGAFRIASDTFDIERAAAKLHIQMKESLPEKQFYIYDLLFIQNKDEEEVAIMLGYKSNEKGRKAGYKQIKNLRKKFKDEAKRILLTKDICS